MKKENKTKATDSHNSESVRISADLKGRLLDYCKTRRPKVSMRDAMDMAVGNYLRSRKADGK